VVGEAKHPEMEPKIRPVDMRSVVCTPSRGSNVAANDSDQDFDATEIVTRIETIAATCPIHKAD